MRQGLEPEDIAFIDDDEGYAYPPSYVMDSWYQNDRHGTYPNGRGYDDQDPALMADWRRITRRFGVIWDEVKAETETEKMMQSDERDLDMSSLMP